MGRYNSRRMRRSSGDGRILSAGCSRNRVEDGGRKTRSWLVFSVFVPYLSWLAKGSCFYLSGKNSDMDFLPRCPVLSDYRRQSSQTRLFSEKLISCLSFSRLVKYRIHPRFWVLQIGRYSSYLPVSGGESENPSESTFSTKNIKRHAPGPVWSSYTLPPLPFFFPISTFPISKV